MVKLNLDLPENFFEPEEICGYYVSKEMKELWAIELDLLNKLDEVCKKHDIKYYLMFGSLLGAVRHKGFIPWDDDIDVIFSRDEYDKLKLYKDEFKHPYFFQNDYTDPGSHTFFAKLRNSDTTAILKTEPEYTFNQGIFIDLFVMDNVPDDEVEYDKFFKKISLCRKLSLYWSRAYDTKSFHSKYHILVLAVYATKWFVKLFRIPNFFLRKLDRLAQKYRNKETVKWALLSLGAKCDFKREWFNDAILLDFHSMKVLCPKEYEKILTERYGDWREYVIGTQVHTTEIMDTGRSYKEYI